MIHIMMIEDLNLNAVMLLSGNILVTFKDNGYQNVQDVHNIHLHMNLEPLVRPQIP